MLPSPGIIESWLRFARTAAQARAPVQIVNYIPWAHNRRHMFARRVKQQWHVDFSEPTAFGGA